ncbi:MAG: hypothetical protein Fur0026_10560 [Sideroxydans sp.]
MRHALLTLCFCTITTLAHALGPDPARDWVSAESAHFRISYASPQRLQAERITGIAEQVHARLARELGWSPQGKTEIIVLDEFDLANGFSTPLPFNLTALFLSPPDSGELLENSEWLELLITHELTHTFHLDKARDLPAGLRYIFGRNPLFFPNVFQPAWAIEGVATLNESMPELGRGRLRSPLFEAWMRIEHARGFRSLAEINANGRALPTSKEYLYGAYFYDFLRRRYGPEAIRRYIDQYSGNFPLFARVYSSPEYTTGKNMEELWDEFIADLDAQMTLRETPIKAAPRHDGNVILPARFNIYALAPAPDGVLAVVDDGVLNPRLLRIDAQGKTSFLTEVQSGARIDVHQDGRVLIAQPEICRNFSLYYDLYIWSAPAGMQRMTECGRYRRAVWLGDQIAVLHMEGGASTLRLLAQDKGGMRETRELYRTPPGAEATDLAANPDGRHIALILKQAGIWQVLEFDQTGNDPKVLLQHDAPLSGLRYARSGEGIEFITASDGVYNLWLHAMNGQESSRVSNTHTAVLLHGGIRQDGSAILGVLADGGIELRAMQAGTPFAQTVLGGRQTSGVPDGTPPAAPILGEADNYHAWNSLYPRSWWPVLLSDRGLTAYGLYTFGSDALGWHNYSANLLWETSQHEALGDFSYAYLDRHFFNIRRNLWARQWIGAKGKETTLVYDRTTDAQWVSMLPWLERERRIQLGIGAAMQTTDRVQIAGLTTRPQDERVVAAFLRYDTRDSNWYADGYNRGNLGILRYESYRPFDAQYDGQIMRIDTRSYLPLGRTVLEVKWTEARAHGNTEAFQLGGALGNDEYYQVPTLNQRNLPLRGYAGDEWQLRGLNMRTLGIEWRTPIADIDRHAMIPPVGINRLSGAVFMDAGRAWNIGSGMPHYHRGVGIELIGEIKLYYFIPLSLRLGLARGMDDPAMTRAYLQLGQAL